MNGTSYGLGRYIGDYFYRLTASTSPRYFHKVVAIPNPRLVAWGGDKPWGTNASNDPIECFEGSGNRNVTLTQFRLNDWMNVGYVESHVGNETPQTYPHQNWADYIDDLEIRDNQFNPPLDQAIKLGKFCSQVTVKDNTSAGDKTAF